MTIVRFALSVLFGSLLMMGETGTVLAYVDPCQALGVACPPQGTIEEPPKQETPPQKSGEGSPWPPAPSSTPSTPQSATPTPKPILYTPPSDTTPERVTPATENEPLHSGAPLSRSGIGGLASLFLLSIGGTVCFRKFLYP